MSYFHLSFSASRAFLKQLFRRRRWQRGWEEGSFLHLPPKQAGPEQNAPFPSSLCSLCPQRRKGLLLTTPHCARTPHTPKAHRYWGASTSGRCGPHAPASGDLKYRFPCKSQRRYDLYSASIVLTSQGDPRRWKRWPIYQGFLSSQKWQVGSEDRNESLSLSRSQYPGLSKEILLQPLPVRPNHPKVWSPGTTPCNSSRLAPRPSIQADELQSFAPPGSLLEAASSLSRHTLSPAITPTAPQCHWLLEAHPDFKPIGNLLWALEGQATTLCLTEPTSLGTDSVVSPTSV